MDRVFIVSYPRSGQNYFQRLLQMVSNADDYCELYNCLDPECPGRTLNIKDRVRCLAGRRFQKNHDFDLSLPYWPNDKYVVLFRAPLYSIASYFEFDLKGAGGAGVPLFSLKRTPELHAPSQEVWESYALEKARYWRGFVRKWVKLSENENVAVFRYEDIVSNKNAIEGIFRFSCPDYKEDRLSAAIDDQLKGLSSGSKPARDISNFDYAIDRKLVDEIRKEIGEDTLSMAGLKDIV